MECLNVHDPSIIKEGEWFYCYNTDVAYGADARVGTKVRKSKNLVNWVSPEMNTRLK